MTPKRAGHEWEFKARFRRHAFGWKSQPAITRVKQAVSEIKQVARRDLRLAAEGAVIFLERVSPAIEHVDGSSGAIGAAVNRAVAELVPLIAGEPLTFSHRDHGSFPCGSRRSGNWNARLLAVSGLDRTKVTLRKCPPRTGLQVALEPDGGPFVCKLHRHDDGPRPVRNGVT